MIQIQIDEEIVKKMLQEAINKKVAEIDKELVFWDTAELKRRTCLSWNTIQNTFFWEEDFPKVKLGGKWMYHAAEAQVFLEKWFNERRYK